MFDPNLGRWMQNDPLEFEAGDANLYRFVANNPVNLTDPSGLEPWVGDPRDPRSPKGVSRGPCN